MQTAICVKVANIQGGFDTAELNEKLRAGWTVNSGYASTDNSLLIILDEPKTETDVQN